MNVLGCFALGILVHTPTAAAGTWVRPLLGIGVCGALTTYSTLAYETHTLARAGSRLLAVATMAASVGAGTGAVLLGTTLDAVLWT